jgi:hypothetical protein
MKKSLKKTDRDQVGGLNPATSLPAAVPKRLRRLKWNELVCIGDFVENGPQEFAPWEGPGGFRADAFVKTIYRRFARMKKTA